MDSKKFLSTFMVMILMVMAFMFFTRGGFGGGGSSTPPKPHPMYQVIASQPKASEEGLTPRTITLGSASPQDPDLLAVRVSNVSAGIDQVQLNQRDYAETVTRTDPLTLFNAQKDLAKPFSDLGIHITRGNSTAELPYGLMPPYSKRSPNMTRADLRPATELDQAADIAESNSTNMLDSQYIWKIEEDRTTHTDAVFSITFQLNGSPVAKIFKHFHLEPGSYELTVSHELQNLSDQPLHVRIDQTAGPDLWHDDPQLDDRYYHALHLDTTDKAKLTVNTEKAFNVTHVELPKFTDATRTVGQFSDFTNNPTLWVASSNRFFTSLVRPRPESTTSATVRLIGEQNLPETHHLASVNIDVMKYADKPAENQAILRLTGTSLEVAPKSTLVEPLAVYLGPKKQDILKGDFAAQPGTPQYEHALFHYASLIQYQQGCYSFCVRDVVVEPILWLLEILKRSVAFGNYGVAIMILVILVRTVLHPLTRASQVNMAKMGKQMREVQPQLEAMKKKYPDNKKKQSEEMMRIYRENKINPAGGIMGCLPMFIQIPIWAALYAGLRADINLRHAAFIPGWINDLASPDTIFPSSVIKPGHPAFTLPLLGWDVYGLNLLPLLLTAVFYFQMKVTTATQPKPADDQQAQMQKMSQYMIFIFPLFLYNAPSGLNLYIFASTMGGLLDTYIVRKALKKQGILAPSASLLPTHEDADK